MQEHERHQRRANRNDDRAGKGVKQRDWHSSKEYLFDNPGSQQKKQSSSKRNCGKGVTSEDSW